MLHSSQGVEEVCTPGASTLAEETGEVLQREPLRGGEEDSLFESEGEMERVFMPTSIHRERLDAERYQRLDAERYHLHSERLDAQRYQLYRPCCAITSIAHAA